VLLSNFISKLSSSLASDITNFTVRDLLFLSKDVLKESSSKKSSSAFWGAVPTASVIMFLYSVIKTHP
jgi:hypothetical protein